MYLEYCTVVSAFEFCCQIKGTFWNIFVEVIPSVMTAVLKCVVTKITPQDDFLNTFSSYWGITAGVISLEPVHLMY